QVSEWVGVNKTNRYTFQKKYNANGTYYIYAKDDVGNINKISFQVSHVDVNGPRITSASITSTVSYNNLTPTIQMNAWDETEFSMCISNTGYEKGCNYEKYSSNKIWNVGGSLDGGTRTIYITLKDLAGNKTNKELKYNVYKECSGDPNTEKIIYGTYSPCNKACGGGTQSAINTIQDRYTNKTCSNPKVERACNTQDCCSRTTRSGASAWKTCNAQCGTGTQTRDVYYVSYYDSNVSCPTKVNEESQSCKIRDCCTSSNIVEDYRGNWSQVCVPNNGKCGTGTQTRPIYYKSKYTDVNGRQPSCSNYTKPAEESRTCQAIDCCSSVAVESVDPGTCNKTCGGGVRIETTYYKSTYTGERCTNKTTTKEIACNTQSCEDPSNYDWSKEITCNPFKFENLVKNDINKFATYIRYQNFRKAMYDCSSTTAPVIKGSAAAIGKMKSARDIITNQSLFEVVSGYPSLAEGGKYHSCACHPDNCDSITSSDSPCALNAYVKAHSTLLYNGPAFVFTASQSDIPSSISSASKAYHISCSSCPEPILWGWGRNGIYSGSYFIYLTNGSSVYAQSMGYCTENAEGKINSIFVDQINANCDALTDVYKGQSGTASYTIIPNVMRFMSSVKVIPGMEGYTSTEMLSGQRRNYIFYNYKIHVQIFKI
ncbi:MAG: hypothetical protein HFH86_04040, partial [Bacilli bacterium]|nr:hypothetical protein [Bacilli bacterium]